MADIMMQLGGYQFSVDTAAYQQLQRSTQYKWASQDRIGEREALQHTGPGTDTITLTGTVLPLYKGGTTQLDAMRAEGDKGKPLLLVDGRGCNHGQWVLEKIDETGEIYAQAGVAKRQSFSLKLRKYSDGA